MPEMILSRKNEIIKAAVQLSSSADQRRKQKLYFIEGARLCADAASSQVPVKILLYTEQAEEKYSDYLLPVRQAAEKVYLLGPQAAQALSCTKTPQGVFCICEMPEERTDSAEGYSLGSYLALENLQDPANMGTILRTAEALGVNGVILGGHCCDIYSPKVLRASMGAVFRLPTFIKQDLPQALAELNRQGFVTAASVPDTGALPVTKMDFSVPCVLAVGNEGNGLTEETRRACGVQTTIPMLGRAESLNASAAAAVLIWEMMRNKAGGTAL